MTKMDEETLQVSLTAKASPDPAQTTLQVPKLCLSLTGAAREVMVRVWQDIRTLEAKEIPLGPGTKGYLMHVHWQEVLGEQKKACPAFDPKQIAAALKTN